MTFKEYYKHVGGLIVVLVFLQLLNPLQLAPFIAYILLVVCLLTKQRVLLNHIDANFTILLVFGLTYSAFNAFGDHKGFQYLVLQAIFPAFFYLLGKFLIVPGMSRKHILYLLIILVVTFGATSLISVLTDLVQGGFAQTGRLIKEVGTGNYVKATGLSGFMIYILTFPAIIFSIRKGYPLPFKIILAAVYIMALLCIFRLGSRTGIAITAITLIVGLLILLAKQTAVNNLKLGFSIIVVAAVIYLFVPIDLNADYLSTLGHRLRNPQTSDAASAGGRTELWLNALQNLYKHPLGWHADRYAHNLWLDLAKTSGVIPLVFLTLFNIRNLLNLRLLFKLGDQYNLGLHLTFLLFTVGPLIYFFVEPVLDGSFFAITFYCLLQGILKSYIQKAPVMVRVQAVSQNVV